MDPRSKSHAETAPAVSTQHVVSRLPDLAIQWVWPGTAQTQFAKEPRSVGRDRTCDTQLDGNETSRKHAELRIEGPLFTIHDLGSRNGVFVNGAKVQRLALKQGDVVRLGEWLGVVVLCDLSSDFSFRDIGVNWYGSRKLALAVEPARRVAVSDLPIVIEGETGTGKEGLARAVHEWSGRKGQFVGVNCATIQPDLAEAALFGHSKGAFTGADRRAIGFFRAANGGTLLLDEVSELPLQVQAKLLRALEQHEVVPVGETEPVRVDVRILAAMQGPLQAAVQDKRFRADLMARLDGLTVRLPPLRERREDVVPLLMAFLREHSNGKPPATDHRMLEQLMLYDWPLNVRELAHLARRFLALHAAEPLLRRSFLPARMLQNEAVPSSMGQREGKPARAATQDEQAFEQLVEALRTHAGNVARAAASLGISRSRAYRLLDARPGFEISDLRDRNSDS
jgi:two-component system response regulator FlrC